MAWTAIETFDSYNYGSNPSINTLNGGSNWNGAWNLTGGTAIVTTAQANGQGCGALQSTDTTGNMAVTRPITAISAGTFYFQFYLTDQTSGQQVQILLRDSANTGGAPNTNRMGININNVGGRVSSTDGQTYNTNLFAWTASAWNTVAIQFDSGSGNVFQLSVNGSAFSANQNSGGAISNIDNVLIIDQYTNAHTFQIDDIATSAQAICTAGGGRDARFLTLLGVG